MGVNVELKRKITVNGRDYESLVDIPEEFQAAIQSALASSAVETKINVNGKTYSSVEELPAPLRAVVGEPGVSVKMIGVAIGLAAILFWLARLVF